MNTGFEEGKVSGYMNPRVDEKESWRNEILCELKATTVTAVTILQNYFYTISQRKFVVFVRSFIQSTVFRNCNVEVALISSKKN